MANMANKIDSTMARIVEMVNAAAPSRPGSYFNGGVQAVWNVGDHSVTLVCDARFERNGEPTIRVSVHGSCSYLNVAEARDFHALYGTVVDTASAVQAYVAEVALV